MTEKIILKETITKGNPEVKKTTKKKYYKPKKKREILDIIEPQNLPISSSYNSRLVFKFIQPIPNQSCLDYDKQIQNVIFLSKIPDETNVVILHEKKTGQTSAGIAKNVDLRTDIDENIGNMVSDLKSKIFSTVLKQ